MLSKKLLGGWLTKIITSVFSRKMAAAFRLEGIPMLYIIETGISELFIMMLKG